MNADRRSGEFGGKCIRSDKPIQAQPTSIQSRRPAVRLYHRKPFYLKLGFLTLKYSGDIFRRETSRREVFIRIRKFEKSERINHFKFNSRHCKS